MTIIASYGGIDDNSYIALTDAASFIETSIVNYTAWTSATTPQREAALIEASRNIDSRNYIGGRYFYDQRLEFPRELQLAFPWNRTSVSSTTFSIEYGRMERAVKEATCWEALAVLRRGGRDKLLEMRNSGVRGYRKQVGPVDEQFQFATGMGISMLCPEALTLLAPWQTSRKVYRG